MSAFSRQALFWTPRALSIAFLAFLSLFALDVFAGNLGLWQTVRALTMHLIPVFVLAVVLALAWRWEWIGAASYAAAGLFYVSQVVFMARPLPLAVKLNWMFVIAGPAFVIAGLFLLNWLKRADLRQ